MSKEILEDIGADFDNFLAVRDWKGAQAIIDNLWDTNHSAEAEALRRALLEAQATV